MIVKFISRVAHSSGFTFLTSISVSVESFLTRFAFARNRRRTAASSCRNFATSAEFFSSDFITKTLRAAGFFHFRAHFNGTIYIPTATDHSDKPPSVCLGVSSIHAIP
jgi:hypothetical protein